LALGQSFSGRKRIKETKRTGSCSKNPRERGLARGKKYLVVKKGNRWTYRKSLCKAKNDKRPEKRGEKGGEGSKGAFDERKHKKKGGKT